jgi:hypothetical protein
MEYRALVKNIDRGKLKYLRRNCPTPIMPIANQHVQPVKHL